MRRAVLSSLFVLSLAGGASAAAPDCSSPRVQGYILAHIGRGIQESSNRPARDRLIYGPIGSATTVSFAAGKLTCEITIDVSVHGAPRQLHGQFHILVGPKGGFRGWGWKPGY